ADAAKVGRAFSNKAIEMALAHYPGFHTTGPPREESPYAVYWPTVVPASLIAQTVHLDGVEYTVPQSPRRRHRARCRRHPRRRPCCRRRLAGRPGARRSDESWARAPATRAVTPTSGSGRGRPRPTRGCSRLLPLTR